MYFRYLQTLYLLLILTGCSEPEPDYRTFLSETTKRISDQQVVLDKITTKNQSLFLRSYNGQWFGTDGDYEIELQPNGKAILFEFGQVYVKYPSTYSLLKDNQDGGLNLKLSIDGYSSDWPVMSAYQDGDELLLIPANGFSGNVTGFSHEDAIPDNSDSYFWPFRQIERKRK